MSELTANKIDDEEEDLYTIPHPKRSLIGIFISTFFLRVAFGSTTVLMPIYIFQHLEGLDGWIGHLSIVIVEITYAIAVILSSGYFGFRSDTSNSKRWILMGTAAGGIILAGYGICALNWDGWIGITPLVNGLLIFGMSVYHFLHGLAGSCKVNASYGYISRFSVYENRATRIGFYNAFVTGGRAVGVILAGVLYDSIVGVTELGGTSWAPTNPHRLIYLYLIFGFAILISAVVVYFMLDKTKSVVKEEKYSIKKEVLTSWRLIKDKSRRGIVLPLLGTASIIGILNNWGFLVLSLESTPGAASWTTVLFTVAIGAPMALWGYLADKIGRKKTLWIGVAGLLIMSVMIGIAFFGNFLTGGTKAFVDYIPTSLSNLKTTIFSGGGFEHWYDPSSTFNTSGFVEIENLWLTILLVISLLMGSAYFPAISGRLGDSSSLGVTDEEVDETQELERTAEFHGATMSIQQTILSISEIIGIVVGGLALIIVYALAKTATNFAYNMIGMLIPIVVLLIFTTIVSFLWPAEDDFIASSKVRRKKQVEK
ncbi:MAG: MFS transporter [Candidatus Heimdallarchaeaceae archaeon]